MAGGPLTLRELTAFIIERCPSGSALDRLAAASAISQELSRLGDALVGHYVEAARQDGRSWSDIGQRLGVTRQAAQQRFVTAGPEVSKVLGRFGDSARRALELAQQEAARLNHEYLGTEHLLLGLIAEGEGAAAQALGALGLTSPTTRARVEEIIGRGEVSCPRPVPFTPRFKKVLRLALQEAEAMGDHEVDSEHVLLALVREGEGVAAQILKGEGADEQRTRLQVSALLGRPCAPAAKSPGRRSFRRSK